MPFESHCYWHRDSILILSQFSSILLWFCCCHVFNSKPEVENRWKSGLDSRSIKALCKIMFFCVMYRIRWNFILPIFAFTSQHCLLFLSMRASLVLRGCCDLSKLKGMNGMRNARVYVELTIIVSIKYYIPFIYVNLPLHDHNIKLQFFFHLLSKSADALSRSTRK